MSLEEKGKFIPFHIALDNKNGTLKKVLEDNPLAFSSILRRVESNSKGIRNMIKLANYQHYFYTDVKTDPNPTDFFYFYKKNYWPIISLLIKNDNPRNLRLFLDKINLDEANFWRSSVINGLLFYSCKSMCFQSTKYLLSRYTFDFRSYMEDRRIGVIDCLKSIFENEKIYILEMIIQKSNLKSRKTYCFRLFKACMLSLMKVEHFRILWDYLAEKDDKRTVEELIDISLEYDRPDIFDFLINDRKNSFKLIIDSYFYQWYNDLRHENQSRSIGIYLVRHYSDKLIQFIEKDFTNDAEDLCDVAVYNFRLPGNSFKELEVYLSIGTFRRSFAKKLYLTILRQWFKGISHNFHSDDRAIRLMRLSNLLMKFSQMYKLSLEPFSKLFFKYCFKKLSIEEEYLDEFLKFAKYTYALLIKHGCLFNSYVRYLNDKELSKLMWLGLNGNISPKRKWLNDNGLPTIKSLCLLSSYVVRKHIKRPFSGSLDNLFGNNWILKDAINFGSLLENFLNIDLNEGNDKVTIKSLDYIYEENDSCYNCPISIPEHLRSENYVEPCYEIDAQNFRY
ncbi:unnamed protein product [Dimorphilus gyrociliatus]|uniref:Uncharacterized protein n=1 Tax=Dimorphilus gyrociliatus TaxID=2664684 RepID=A0A7I8W8P5_9ANNE|nr:unnamed protein product [Dimorphilus gyrociliatus]